MTSHALLLWRGCGWANALERALTPIIGLRVLHALQDIGKIVHGVTEAMGGTASCNYIHGFPVTINHELQTAHATAGNSQVTAQHAKAQPPPRRGGACVG